MEKIVELQIFLTFRKLYQNFEQYGFGLEKKFDFAMDIDKLNLANLLGKVMNKIMEYQPDAKYFAKVYRKIKAWKSWNLSCIENQETSPKNHISRQK